MGEHDSNSHIISSPLVYPMTRVGQIDLRLCLTSYFPILIAYETTVFIFEDTWGVNINKIFEVKTVQRDSSEDSEALKQECPHLEDDLLEKIVAFKSLCLKEPTVIHLGYMSAIKVIEGVPTNESFMEDEGQPL